MEKEYCPTCGQELPYDDITLECELRQHKAGDKYLIAIEHRGKHVLYLGLESESKQPYEQDYHIKEVYKTGDGTGWWFRVLKVRRHQAERCHIGYCAKKKEKYGGGWSRDLGEGRCPICGDRL